MAPKTDSAVKGLLDIRQYPDLAVQYIARRKLWFFAMFMQPDMDMQPFHDEYYHVLDMFAHGKIRKLIVTMPPQHGKSEGSSRKLPAFMLGLNPDLRIGIGSYSATNARDFNRDIQRIIDTPEYRTLFPGTLLNSMNAVTMNTWLRNSDVFEIVGRRGSLRVAGRGGALTGKTVDVMILDDVYKDYEEGNSPVIRKRAWKWYTAVVRKRLHNKSQELIVFTRWHRDDLIGMIGEKETVIEAKSRADLENIPGGAWIRINFEAIKKSEPTEIDPRPKGVALWENRHSLQKLEMERILDPVQFECLNQGNPQSGEGLLYKRFKTYVNTDGWGARTARRNYTDVADEGDDYLVSICYDRHETGETVFNPHAGKPEKLVYLLVTDVIMTDRDTDVTNESVPQMLNRNRTETAYVESNGGGAGFARTIQKKTGARIEAFHQGGNKESRITSLCGLVDTHVVMPFDWDERYPKFYSHVTQFLRDFSANGHDDAADALTGIVEKEILQRQAVRGVRLRN